MRCTCESMSLAASKLTTVFTEVMSNPRDATSVATNTLKVPFLNSLITLSRSPWSRSPWMAAAARKE